MGRTDRGPVCEPRPFRAFFVVAASANRGRFAAEEATPSAPRWTTTGSPVGFTSRTT